MKVYVYIVPKLLLKMYSWWWLWLGKWDSPKYSAPHWRNMSFANHQQESRGLDVPSVVTWWKSKNSRGALQKKQHFWLIGVSIQTLNLNTGNNMQQLSSRIFRWKISHYSWHTKKQSPLFPVLATKITKITDQNQAIPIPSMGRLYILPAWKP